MGGKNRTAVETLYRGDSAQGVAVPDPSAKLGVVEHILYLGGHGRPTQFTSTTESESVAEVFAGTTGKVWLTTASAAKVEGAKHHPREQLLHNLKGYGKGKAKHTTAWEVAQAANYVKQWSEHLLDWSEVSTKNIQAAIGRAFAPRGGK